MSALHRIKRSFTAGEISPLLSMRADNQRYDNGCHQLFNMYAKPQGPVIRRSGFEFIHHLTDAKYLSFNDTYSPFRPRLIPFIYNEIQAYVIILYHDDVNYNPRLKIAWGGQDGTEFGASDAPPGMVLNLNTGNPLELGFPSGWNATDASDPNYPVGPPIELDRVNYAQSGDILYLVFGTYPIIEIKRLGHNDWTRSRFQFEPGDKPQDPLKSPPGINNPYAYFWPHHIGFFEQRLYFAGHDKNWTNKSRPQTIWFSRSGNFHDFENSDPDDGTVRDDHGITITLDSGTQNKITWMSPQAKILIGTVGDEWVLSGANSEPLTPTSISAKRHTQEGSSGFRLHPIIAKHTTIFVDRYRKRLNTFVYNFDIDSYSINDLSILAPHLTESYGKEREATTQNPFGYNYKKNQILDWAYQERPNSIIWCVRMDGTLIALTYQEEHNILGWHRHETQGKIVAIGVIPGLKEDDVWILVERGNTDNFDAQDHRLFLERLAPEFTYDTPVDAQMLDSFLTAHVPGPSHTTLTGLEHLNGKTAQVLADGAYVGEYPVVGGEIYLGDQNHKVTEEYIAGLGYDSYVEPTIPDIVQNDGTLFGRRQRIVYLDTMFMKTVGGVYQTTDPDGVVKEEEIAFRLPTHPTGAPVPLYTGMRRFEFLNGWDNQPNYRFLQRYPLPFCLLGAVDVIETDE